MTISLPRELLYNASVATAAEVTSQLFYPHPGATRTVFRFDSDTINLTVDIDEFGMDGNYYEIDAGRVITAGTPLVLVFDYGLGPTRVRFTPASGAATTVVIEASYGGVPQM
jgi:hypothetical protein